MTLAIFAFSKDRAMQCDAMIRSFEAHAKNIPPDTKRYVLYRPTSAQHERQYLQLWDKHNQWQFIRESDGAFKSHLSALADDKSITKVLWIVDDTIFVKDFDLTACVKALDENKDAVGVSLRLGSNCVWNYPGNKPQSPPVATEPCGEGLFKFPWDLMEGDFAYPLELSSSLFRMRDIEMPLKAGEYAGPNQLEDILNSYKYNTGRHKLMMYEISRAFACPVNMTQTTYTANRVGREAHMSIQSLADKFDQGLRIDISKFDGTTPKGCHEEHDLVLV